MNLHFFEILKIQKLFRRSAEVFLNCALWISKSNISINFHPKIVFCYCILSVSFLVFHLLKRKEHFLRNFNRFKKSSSLTWVKVFVNGFSSIFIMTEKPLGFVDFSFKKKRKRFIFNITWLVSMQRAFIRTNFKFLISLTILLQIFYCFTLFNDERFI